LIVKADILIGTATGDVYSHLERVRAPYFAEIVTPLKDAVVLLDAIAAVVSREAGHGKIGHCTEPVARQQLGEGYAQAAAPEGHILRIPHNDIVRETEAQVIHRARREDMGRIDHGDVRRPRTSSRHDPEIAALESVQNLPFVMDPAVIDLRLGRED